MKSQYISGGGNAMKNIDAFGFPPEDYLFVYSIHYMNPKSLIQKTLLI